MLRFRLVFLSIVLSATGALVLAACAPAEKLTVESVRRGGLGLGQFDDIPVPRKFRYDTEKSYRYPEGPIAEDRFRLGEFHYWRSGDHVDLVRAFFANEMIQADYGWTAVEDEGGVQVFRKGTDTVTIRCRHQANGQTRIVIGLNHDPK